MELGNSFKPDANLDEEKLSTLKWDIHTTAGMMFLIIGLLLVAWLR